jgi:hypothetical protein
MIRINALKSLLFYKNQKILFEKKKNPNKETVIFSVTNNIDETFSLIKSQLFLDQYIKSFFTPKRFNRSQIKKTAVLNQQEVYKKVKEELPHIKKVKVEISNYDLDNLYYDLSKEINFFKSNTILVGAKKQESFISLLKEIFFEEINEYKEKIVLIPIDFFDEKELNSLNSDEIASIFFNGLKNNLINSERFKNINFIFSDKNFKTFFILNDFNEKNLATKFRNKVVTLSKISKGEELSSEEKLELSSKPEVKETNIVSDKEKNIAILKNNISNKVLNLFNPNLISVQNLSGAEIKIKNDVSEIIEDDLERSYKDGMTEEEALDELDKNDSLKEYLNSVKEDRVALRKLEIQGRKIESLRTEQKKVSFGNTSLKNIFEEIKAKNLEIEEIPVDTLNKQIKVSKLKELDRNYNKYQNEKDQAAIFASLSLDEEFPVFVKSIEKEDTSDDFTKKETYKVTYQEPSGKKHLFKIDVPIITDDRFLYINNGKKMMTKQITRLPVAKIKPDTVELTTNYNKLVITRFGNKFSPSITKLEKLLTSDEDLKKKVKVVLGDSTIVNSEYLNTLEYDEISNFLLSLKIGDFDFNFNRSLINMELEKIGITEDDDKNTLIKKNEIPVGVNVKEKGIIVISANNESILYRTSKGEEKLGDNLIEGVIETIRRNVDPDIEKKFSDISYGKKFVYNRVTIAGKKIPLVVILSLYKGLNEILRRYEVPYEFSEKRKTMSAKEEGKWNVIKFQDGYLYYPAHPIRYSLLLNGLAEMNPNEYKFSDFSENKAYLDYLEYNFGSRNISKGLINTMSLMMDPITKDILQELKLPDDFVGIMLHINTLLETNIYRKQNDLSGYRIRGNEQINSYLYNILANAFKNYKDSVKAGKKDAKISVPENQLIKELVESPILDEYSILNPILEVEKLGSSTYKGPAGINLDEAFTMDIRAYDPSMAGILALNTPDSATVGIVRQLSYNPAIINNRGFLDTNKNIKDMNSVDLISPAELMSTFTSRHADPPRVGII